MRYYLANISKLTIVPKVAIILNIDQKVGTWGEITTYNR